MTSYTLYSVSYIKYIVHVLQSAQPLMASYTTVALREGSRMKTNVILFVKCQLYLGKFIPGLFHSLSFCSIFLAIFIQPTESRLYFDKSTVNFFKVFFCKDFSWWKERCDNDKRQFHNRIDKSTVNKLFFSEILL